MKFRVKDIATLIGGKVKGNPELEISSLAKIDDQNASTDSICFLANLKYENFLYESKAGAVIISKDFTPKKEVIPTLILVKDPYSAFTQLLEQYQKLTKKSPLGIKEPTVISPSSRIAENVFIAPFSSIGDNSTIGENVKIYPNVFIDENVSIGKGTIIHAGAKVFHQTVIGENCIIHAGVVIGSDGFGFAPQEDGSYKTIPQLGNVVIEDNVSIGANTTIDRATMGSTIIRKGVKLDNLIQIGHNVEVEENTVISAQTGISGSSKIGKNCVIGGQVGIANSIQIPDNTKIGAQSGINSTPKKEGLSIQGYPAFDYSGFMKSSVVFRKLPELKKRIDKLEKNLSSLEDFQKLKAQIKELEEKILNLPR